jgi:hypothetical protein
MNKSKILENFKNISNSEGVFAAYQFLCSNFETDKLIQFIINNQKTTFQNSEFGDFLNVHVDELDKIMSNNLWDEFLYWFMTTPEVRSLETLEKIAQSYPDKFVASIRFTRSFLDREINTTVENIVLPEIYRNHQKLWQKLYEDDIKMWNQVSSDQMIWKNYKTSDFLGNLINWLEVKRFEDSTNEKLDLLSKSYSFIISYYLSEHYNNALDLNLDNLNSSFWNSFEKMDSSLFNSFEHILEYVWFQEAILIPYSFDHNIEPIFNGDTLDFKYKNEKVLSDWRKNGVRYAANQIRYKEFGLKISSYLIHEEGVQIPKGKSEQDQLNNLELFINSNTTKALLSDLHLNEIKIKGKVHNAHHIIQPIIAYSFNRKLRYEDKLEQLRPNSNSWQWSYFELNELSKKKDVDCYPFFLMSRKDYISHNLQANHREQENIYEELIAQFGYRITEKFRFDRHNLGYDVWYKPFLLLGDQLFCPMMFFATNEWFYSFAQIVIKNYTYNANLRKSSSIAMEKDLLERFAHLNPRWKCSIPEFEHDGDIDLIVSDGNTDLLIQLKRTYFRTSLKDAYFETIRSDRKAISQLVNGEAFIMENKTQPLSEKRTKWLVSTSFENVNQVFEDCRKVNYMDLLWVLSNKKFDSINELNNYIANDEILDETPFK